jgi:hypothetical protein
MQARTVPQGPTADEAVREWQSLGLTTLEEVAARALAADKSDRTALTRLPIDFDAVFSETPSELARTIRYGTTDYVVVVDGTETKDVSAYDGQVLHFVAEPAPFAEGRIHAFTALPELKTRLMTLADEGPIMVSPPDSLTPDCFFWDDAGFSGNVKSVPAGFEFRDLTRVRRNVFWQDWNDVISSIDPSRSFRVAWQDVEDSGPSLSMAPGWGHGNLTQIGWNDRISAIANFG